MIKRGYFIAYVLLIIALIVWLVSCTAAKDNKALGRVISKQKLANRAFAVLEKSHPCVTTPGKVIPGKDSIIHDTLSDDETINFLNGQIDSLLSVHCQNTNLDSLKKAIAKQIKLNCNPVHIYHTRVDTFPVEDTRRLNILNDTLQATRGRYQQLQTQLADTKKTSSKKTWWIVGLAALIAGGIFLKIKKLI